MLNSTKRNPTQQKKREELVEEMVPQFETFLESREKYIKALETTIDVLKNDIAHRNHGNLNVRSSIDELVVMQRLSSTISTCGNTGCNLERID